MPIIEVAKNSFYIIIVDTHKNRIYFKIQGTWRNVGDVPNYLNDWKTALGQMRRGFTILADLADAKTAFKEIKALHEQAQKLLVAGGLARTAEVFPADAVLKIQVDAIAKSSGMAKSVFQNFQEAERWLNQISPATMAVPRYDVRR